MEDVRERASTRLSWEEEIKRPDYSGPGELKGQQGCSGLHLGKYIADDIRKVTKRMEREERCKDLRFT